MSKNRVAIALTALIVFSLLFLAVPNGKSRTTHLLPAPQGDEVTETRGACSALPIPYDSKARDDPCVERPKQDSIGAVLAFASEPENKIKKLECPCEEREYTWATLDEVRLRVLRMYTELALAELNRRCEQFAAKVAKARPRSATCERRVLRPFHFGFIQIINATSSVDKHGNSRWRVDLMVEEMVLHLSRRLMLDFTVMVAYPTQKSKTIATCAEYTSFPFPRYPFGYPAMEQLVPLPTQVINTGPGEVLSHAGIDADYPRFKAIYLNRVWQENSDLALGTELPVTLNSSTAGALNDTTLASSAYPKKRLQRHDVQFPEKDYADCIEKKGMAKDTDIHNNYALKPCNWNCTGVPENGYHYQGSTESFKQSMLPPTYPNGWIQPAVIRNKWPRLWSEPRDRKAWPCAQVGLNWDNKGIMYPQAKFDSCCTGNRWSTAQQPRTPQYWPTITGLPHNAGPNYWLFNNLRGGNATGGASHPTR